MIDVRRTALLLIIYEEYNGKRLLDVHQAAIVIPDSRIYKWARSWYILFEELQFLVEISRRLTKNGGLGNFDDVSDRFSFYVY